MVCGLIAAVVLARGSVVKAIGMVVLGLLLGIGGEPLHAFIAVKAPGGAGSAPGHGLGQRLARLECRPWRLREHADAIR